MRLIFIFLRKYPLQSVVTLVAMLIVGLLEGFGLSMLLPLLSIASGTNDGSAGEAATAAGSALSQIINNVFQVVGFTPTIGMLLIIFVSCMILKALMSLVANKRVGYIGAQVVADLRLEMIQALFATRWEYFIKQPVGSLTNSIAVETGQAATAYFNGIKIIAAILDLTVYAAIVFLVSWKATVVAFVGGISILFVVRRYIRKAKSAGKRGVILSQSLMSYLTDSLVLIKPLKTMAREHLAGSVLMKKTKSLKKVMKKQVSSKVMLTTAREPLTVSFTALGLYAVLVVWKMPLSSVLVMVYMLSKVLKRLHNIQTLYQVVVTAEYAYWSYNSKLQRAVEEKEAAFGSQRPFLKDSIRLRGVSFTYTDRWILKGAEFDFPANSFTAIVGPSGIGKTTVVDLVTGLLRPDKGEIFIDDIPLAEIDLRHWRQMIGYVPQETLLLHDSVFINVTLGDENLKAEDVESSLREAGAWEFVKDLPDGMFTLVGERGHNLSGGQRQRIAIARALVHRPKLLILDEATTALDPENEAAICETLKKLRGELTILAISHQPAILKAADRAYRIENGKAYLASDLLKNGTEKLDASAAIA